MTPLMDQWKILRELNVCISMRVKMSSSQQWPRSVMPHLDQMHKLVLINKYLIDLIAVLCYVYGFRIYKSYSVFLD